MTRKSDFKKLVRQRMAKTGESYTAARRNLLDEREEPTLEGWSVTGPGDGDPDFELTDYAGGLEPELRHRDKPVAYLRSTVDEPQKHAVIMQSIDSGKYHGQRVRFSAWTKCDADTQRAELWVRVVPRDRNRTLARGVSHTTSDWQRGEVVLDVDPRSASIMFGVALYGVGEVCMSAANFETVDESVPVTREGDVRREPAEPVNLSFEGPQT